MSVDNETLLRQTATDIVRGLDLEEGPPIDELLCSIKERTSQTGTEPVRATEDMAPRQVSEQAMGDDPVEVGFNLGSFAWDLKQISRKFTLTEAQMIDLGQYMDAISEYTTYMRKSARVTREISLKTAMATFTDVAAVGPVWTDPGAKIAQSIQDAIEANCPGCDTLVVGRATRLKLQRSPDLKENYSNYTGSGNMPFSLVRNALAEISGVDASRIFTWETWYNSRGHGKNQATTFTKVNVAGDYFAGFVQRGLVYVRQPGGMGPITTETDHKKTETAWTEYFDHDVVDAGLGFELTGTV